MKNKAQGVITPKDGIAVMITSSEDFSRVCVQFGNLDGEDVARQFVVKFMQSMEGIPYDIASAFYLSPMMQNGRWEASFTFETFTDEFECVWFVNEVLVPFLMMSIGVVRTEPVSPTKH